ncbi:MAG: hypothetical protein JXJ18_03370 [Rhodobacteraceae bacterium]|nr:hypothetical protein [Paracoccaceae bacterium]
MTRRIGSRLGALALVAGLAGCTQFPRVDATAPARAAPTTYPRIVPIEPLLAQIDAPRATPQDATALAARAAGLRRRAAALRAREI